MTWERIASPIDDCKSIKCIGICSLHPSAVQTFKGLVHTSHRCYGLIDSEWIKFKLEWVTIQFQKYRSRLELNPRPLTLWDSGLPLCLWFCDNHCLLFRLPSSGVSGEWTIPQQQRLKYKQIFNSHDPMHKGFLTGNHSIYYHQLTC